MIKINNCHPMATGIVWQGSTDGAGVVGRRKDFGGRFTGMMAARFGRPSLPRPRGCHPESGSGPNSVALPERVSA